MTQKVLMCGNEACGEGAVMAGCTFYAGYPITPQNELTAYIARRFTELDRTFIQAESELAAINMVFGAAAAGARAMTSSSSPGISLKQEGISYIAACELPAVIVNMQRGGPGLGNIAPSQADYFQAVKGGGHGDYRTIVLAPSSAQELFDFTYRAFDLADRYRMPVMILGDGLIGQMMEPLKLSTAGLQSPAQDKPWALTGCKGRRPNVIKSLLLAEGALEALNDRLQEKYARIRKTEVAAETAHIKESDVVLVAYGSVARIARVAMEAARQKGQKVGLVRPITLWPFPEKAVEEAAARAKKILVIEMSAGQMVEDVRLAVAGRTGVDFYGRTGGGIPDAQEILRRIEGYLS